MFDNSFFSDRGYGIGGGSAAERRSASDKAKQRLEELQEVEKRMQESRQEFAQLAIATRLRSEFSAGVCESERRKPIGCRFHYRQLSNGRLFTAELTNQLASAALIDWTVLIELQPLASLDMSEPGKRRSLSSRTYVHTLPRLDSGATVAFEIYCEEDGPMDLSTATRPFVVRCHLARFFRDSETSKGVTLTFRIGTTVMGANNLVYDRSMATFALELKRNDQELDRSDFRFCIAKSLLQLLFPDSTDFEQRFFEWLFPQVQKWPSSVAGEVAIFRSQILTLGTNATVQCSMEKRVKTNDYFVTIEVTSFGFKAADLMTNLKMAVWIKMMLAIRQLRKYQTKIFLDWYPIAAADNALETTELMEYVDSRLPFA